ncbi:porin family protein [Pontibacter roseus]|uniref:porin family protein n=1 Tax=Pontibacter roseus TaxID=336989 RepID=UPI0003642208|nr:porin family protein [Pontibacter roseus]
MKRTVLLLFCLTVLAGTGFAQQVGIKGGATYSTFKGGDTDNYKYRLGYTGGLFLQRHIGSLVGVQVEALYTSKGALRETVVAGNLVEENVRLNYIDVPVLLHLSAGGLFVDLGPQVSFISNAKYVVDAHSNSGDKTVTSRTDITDNPYTVDFAYVGSIGYRASNGIGLEVRYTGGLKNIDDEGAYVRAERRNSSFSLMASYLLSYSR